MITAAAELFVCLCLGARSHWLIRLGAEFRLLVCAGQAVLRTVSVAVRAVGRVDARVHGRIDDMHRAGLS